MSEPLLRGRQVASQCGQSFMDWIQFCRRIAAPADAGGPPVGLVLGGMMATTEEVRFHSFGAALAGTLRLPDGASADAPVPGIVQGPGWLGLRDAKLYAPYHEALLAAGMAILVFDYRGFGDSGGDATYLDPMAQVADWRNAITWLQTRAEIDPGRIGVFGSGGTGGGHAIAVAGLDERVKATVSQVPIADGRDWLHRMRREHEWLEFLERIRVDRERRVTTGTGELVAPRD